MLVYFLFVTLTLVSPPGGDPTGQLVGVFTTASACETAKYEIADYTIDFEIKHKAVAELHCIKHVAKSGNTI